MSPLPRRRLTVALAGLMLLTLPSTASAWEPARRDEAALKRDFAAAYGVAPKLVLEARYYELPGTPRQPGFILGRYKERVGGEWDFPGIAVYFRKPGDRRRDGFYLARTWLGSAATKVTAVGLVDLDAKARSVVRVEGGRWRHTDAPKPGKRRWPALLLAIERVHRPPEEVSLVVVSLKAPDAPEVVLDEPIVHRWPDQTRSEMERTPMPAGAVLGHLLLEVAFERLKEVRRVTLTEVGIGSRWSGCLAPEPYQRVLELTAPPRARYREVPPLGAHPPSPCR